MSHMEDMPNYLLIQYERERERCEGGKREREIGRKEERGREGRRGDGVLLQYVVFKLWGLL